jgi:acyl-coenzyme A thioesterase PaaI-like protein
LNIAFQDSYADSYSHCYGCGRNNANGHQLKSYWDGENTRAEYTPPDIYTGGLPGFAYGGLVASLLDCHGTASAYAFAHRELGLHLGQSDTPIRFVTGQLNLSFLRPTPLGKTLVLTGELDGIEGRKVWVNLTLGDGEQNFAEAKMLAIKLNDGTAK